MTSRVNDATAARIAAIRAGHGQTVQRTAFAERRAYGLTQRHAAKRHLPGRVHVEQRPDAANEQRCYCPETEPAMTATVIPREQAIANARRVLDAACRRRDADYAAGRLTGERLAAFEQLLTDIALALQADATAPTSEEGLRRAEDASGRAFSRDTLDRLGRERTESVWQPKIIAYMDSVASLPERRWSADE
ncbi:hypothetical protein ACWD6R_12620 [Streptomyces sp. NPDC005151]